MSDDQPRQLHDVVLRNRQHFAGRPVLREIYNVFHWSNQGNPVAYAQALSDLKEAERLYDEGERITRQ